MKLGQRLFLVVVGASAALGRLPEFFHKSLDLSVIHSTGARILPKPDFFPVGTGSRIVGGELATIHELPHQARKHLKEFLIHFSSMLSTPTDLVPILVQLPQLRRLRLQRELHYHGCPLLHRIHVQDHRRHQLRSRQRTGQQHLPHRSAGDSTRDGNPPRGLRLRRHSGRGYLLGQGKPFKTIFFTSFYTFFCTALDAFDHERCREAGDLARPR